MTIQLKDGRYINGALQAAGAVVTTNAQLERELVSANLAVYTVAPARNPGALPVYIVDGELFDVEGLPVSSAGGGVGTSNSSLMAAFGDSHVNFFQTHFNVVSYSVTSGTATITLNGTLGTAAGRYVYLFGSGLPVSLMGQQLVATGGTAELTIDNTGLPNTPLTTPIEGQAHLVTYDDTSFGTGAGKGILGFIYYANVAAGNPFDIPASYCFGRTGDTYTPVPSQSKTGLITLMQNHWASMPIKPKWAFFCCGANDANHLSDGVSDISFDNVKRDAAACWEFAIANGATPIVMHVMPAANTSAFDGTYNQWAARINQWIDEYAAINGTIIVVPEIAQAVFDPASTTGGMRSGYSTDGIHFVGLGAHAAGSALATVFKRLAKPRKAKPSSYLDAYSATTPTGCLRNAMNAGAACFGTTVAPVTVTATSAATAHALSAGWVAYRNSATGTVTAEITARTDLDENGIPIAGNELIISFSGTTISDTVTVRTTNGASLHANLSVGDVVYSEMEYLWTDLNTCTVLRPPKAQMVLVENGVSRYTGAIFLNQNVRAEAFGGVDRSCYYKIMRIGTSPSAYPIISMYAPTATSGKLRIRYHTIRKYTAGIPW